ncbi:phenylacetate--CoA ligase family protein [Bacillus massiliigorillae]|uniref:phenylacetate--CoA ligase family protein n=1 Tax=Bacillus massiliigorillae TaxID=1243664 RepID=UPI00039BEF81|nr:AMP-binding protein [Bacillus massiliigorillae]
MIIHEVETYSENEMKALQLTRLQETLKRVYGNVPFYHSKFDELGLKPEDIKTVEDISKLPFTVKADLRNSKPFELFATSMKEVVRIHASSGTSGTPTIVGYTEGDINNWADIVARAIAIAGGEADGVFQNAYGYGLFTGGLGLHYGGERLGMATIPISGGNTTRQINIIEECKPTVIAGTPSYILRIAEEMESMGKDPLESSLKFGIFGAEPWSEELRKVLESKLGIKACDIYGLSEVMGPGIAMECHEAQDGLHIAEDHFIVEVINPDTLQPVPDGEEGELVFTSLTKEASPVIRYRTGDIASITRGTCSCGRTTARMSRVKGRIDDMLIIRGVNVFPSEIEECLLRNEDLVPHYQVHLYHEDAMDHVELHVEINEQIYRNCNDDLKNDYIKTVAKNVRHDMKNYCLVTMKVNVLAPGSIPRSEGKAIRIIDHRKKGLPV